MKFTESPSPDTIIDQQMTDGPSITTAKATVAALSSEILTTVFPFVRITSGFTDDEDVAVHYQLQGSVRAVTLLFSDSESPRFIVWNYMEIDTLVNKTGTVLNATGAETLGIWLMNETDFTSSTDLTVD
jgi:hypothetical protein